MCGPAETFAQGMRMNGSDAVHVVGRFNGPARSKTALLDEFLRLGIPHHVLKGLSFLETALAQDTIAYLRLALNNGDDLAFARVYNTPRRRLSEDLLPTSYSADLVTCCRPRSRLRNGVVCVCC